MPVFPITGVLGPGLVSLADVHAHLNIPAADVSLDTELQGFMDASVPLVEHVVGPVVAAQWVESYDGAGPFITLRHAPVLSIQQVVEYQANNAFVLAQATAPNVGTQYSYSLETDVARLVRRYTGGAVGTFPRGPAAVQVTYTSGRYAIPANVRLGTLELIRHLYDQSQFGGRASYAGDDLADDPTSGAPRSFSMPERVLELLAPSRRHPSIA